MQWSVCRSKGEGWGFSKTLHCKCKVFELPMLNTHMPKTLSTRAYVWWTNWNEHILGTIIGCLPPLIEKPSDWDVLLSRNTVLMAEFSWATAATVCEEFTSSCPKALWERKHKQKTQNLSNEHISGRKWYNHVDGKMMWGTCTHCVFRDQRRGGFMNCFSQMWEAFFSSTEYRCTHGACAILWGLCILPTYTCRRNSMVQQYHEYKHTVIHCLRKHSICTLYAHNRPSCMT